MKIVVIEPHGMCAGVNAAIAKALKLKNVWCLHELVHNEIVIKELQSLGFRFTDDLEAIPDGETVVFSAHGVPPAVRERAKAKSLKIVDLTCPFVAKAHRAAREAAAAGREVLVLGDRRHVEVQGILGEVRAPAPAGGTAPLAVVCQTTLNLDEARREVEEIANTREVASVSWPCNATKERQEAVRKFVASAGASSACVLVLGSRTSANSRRLAEVAEAAGAKAYLAGDPSEVKALAAELERFDTVGVTSGASTPERFFMEAVRLLRHVPEHVAIIMDGNGRWAKARGKKRGEGHIAGAKTLMNVLKWIGDRGIKYLTVYAFSTENWKRPKEEVDGLMALFARYLKTKEREFLKNRVRFRLTGRRGDLSPKLRKVVEALEAKTRDFERQFLVAISYGGRAEIVDAANAAIAAGEPVTEETFKRYLYSPDVPDPDLIIRTSGEIRTSNFLLWESAYAEYHFTPTLWPDFSEADLDAALADYAARHRRVGGV